MAAYGTFSLLTDGEGLGSAATAGTLDLEVDHPTDVELFVTHRNFAPGDVAEGRLHIRNVASIRGDDGAGRLVVMVLTTHANATDARGAATDMPSWLEVTTFRYGVVDLLGLMGDRNRNGWVDLDDTLAVDLHDLPDPGDGTDLTLRVRFHAAAGNDLQGDRTEARFVFTLTQL